MPSAQLVQQYASSTEPESWQRSLQQAIRDPIELWQALDLPFTLLPAAKQAAKQFPIVVPRALLTRMRKGDVDDPILRQVLPLAAELETSSSYFSDPVGDLAAQVAPGLLHKYHGRALLVTTGACGVHCRYCFRREFPYVDAKLGRHQRQAALDYLQQDTSITEVLLSGGDPLSLTDGKLAEWFEQLNAIEHVQRIRLHTRQPIVLPNRVTPELLQLLVDSRASVVIVVHVNHANELDRTTEAALQKLRPACKALLNQSVLLAGVNDRSQTLRQLSEALFAADVLPYYLHQLDKVQGAAHFAVDDDVALQIMAELRADLPGYLVPKLVQEQAGEPAKTPLL